MNTPSRIRPGAILETENGVKLRVEAWQGEGSYARVYRAMPLTGPEPAALKVAKREIPEAATRLIYERRVLGAVPHPKVVRLLDAGCAHDSPFLLLEWLEGENLRDLVAARRRLPLRQALDLFSDACEGTAAIHAAGMAHGDIRAENVVVVPRRGAVITDPGFAVPHAPEITNATADILALGDLLTLMLTGRAPGSGGDALTTTGGFSRSVVELWESTRKQEARASGLNQAAVKLRRAL